MVGGLDGSDNAICPFCRRFDRERLVYLFLHQKTDLFQRPQSLLHVAPELKILEQIRRHPQIRAVTIDLENPLVDARMDLQKLAFADERFDAVICNHVLEHVTDDLIAMRELLRVLKPGGWAILQVPFTPELAVLDQDPSIKESAERERRFGQTGHVRLYGRDYADRLASVGFLVRSHPCTELFDRGTIERHALNPEEIVFFATKPAR